MTLYLDEYGHITTADKAFYVAVLTGSCYYSPAYQGWVHEIDRSKSTVALAEFFHETNLFDT